MEALLLERRNGLTVDALFFEPFVAVFPRGHQIGRCRPVETAVLDGRELLLLDEGHCLRDQVPALCRAARPPFTMPPTWKRSAT